MFLFPIDGILEVILSYGQTFSLFAVFMIFEALIAAKSEKATPGLIFIGAVFVLAIALGIMFDDISFFIYMLIPVVLCIIAFIIARRTRAKNIAKGVKYNKDGLIEEELKKMEHNNQQ